jgi:ABC-type Zn uptake system ZnuABC Zn-binding protein ZnuA
MRYERNFSDFNDALNNSNEALVSKLKLMRRAIVGSDQFEYLFRAGRPGLG